MARSFLIRFLPLVTVLFAAAVVLLVAGDARLALAIGLAAIGVAPVLLVSLLFYEIGHSEARARERERMRQPEHRPR